MLRRAGADTLAEAVDTMGWDCSVLGAVEQVANEALAPRADDLARAKEGMEWMLRWKDLHPEFNTVGEGEF